MMSSQAEALVPFNLREGLYLESSELLLPWNSSAEDLAKCGSPEEDNHHVFWNGVTVFDGLEVDVLCRRQSRNVFQISHRLQSTNARDEFLALKDELVSRFGSPDESASLEADYPRAVWRYGRVRVSLLISDRFGEYVSFMVSNGL
jgi:hypothetical protein